MNHLEIVRHYVRSQFSFSKSVRYPLALFVYINGSAIR